MTHTKKDCTERPRKVGAKFTGKDLASDKHVQELALDYAGKRDNYNGYNPDSYKEVIEEYERIEMERKRQRAERQKRRVEAKKKKAEKKAADGEGTDSGTDTDSDSDSDSDNDSDDDDDGTRIHEGRAKVHDTKDTARGTLSTRTTTRNLRIREDTAKYLMNLDTNSAFYDPKSRSMRDNPYAHLKEDEQGLYRGDNYTRTKGEVQFVNQIDAFAWESYKRGNAIHSLVAPTQAHAAFKDFKERQENAATAVKTNLLDKYGGAEHLEVPEEIHHAATEEYVEYARARPLFTRP